MTLEQDTGLSIHTYAVPELEKPEALKARMNAHPPGLVGILVSGLSEGDFTLSYRRLLTTYGTLETIAGRGEKAAARNALTAALLERPPGFEWVYMLDDDHQIPPTMLLDQLDALYREDLDVLGMLYPERLDPRTARPVAQLFRRGADGRYERRKAEWADLPVYATVWRRDDLAFGAACLLIRRRALETLAPPHFVVGALDPTKELEDVTFCIRCQEAGLRVGLYLGDYKTSGPKGIGHIARIGLWAVRDPMGRWGVSYLMEQGATPPAGPPPTNGRAIVER